MANHPEQLEHSGARTMAGLLLCLVACAPLSGCLLPQDEQVIPDLPPRRDTAPRIVGSTPPSRWISFATSAACRTNEDFKLIVEDEDTGDTLRSMWFIDFKDVTSTTLPTPYTANAVRPLNGALQREVKAPTSTSFTSALSSLAAGTHLLTAYVADREFDEFSGTVVLVNSEIALADGGVLRDRDGGVVLDVGHFDTITWTLQVASCP